MTNRVRDPVLDAEVKAAIDTFDADRLSELGARAAHAGDSATAIALFQAAIAAGGLWAGFNLGQILKECGRYESAAAAFRSAAEAGVVEARINLGNLLSDHMGE